MSFHVNFPRRAQLLTITFQGPPDNNQETLLQRLLRDAGVTPLRVLLLGSRALPAVLDLGGDGTAEGRLAVRLRYPLAADNDPVSGTTQCSTLDGHLENILRYVFLCELSGQNDNIFVHFRADVLDRLPAQPPVAAEPRRSTPFRRVHVPCHHAAAFNAKFLADDGDFHHPAVLRSR